MKRGKCGSTLRISEVRREYGIDHSPRQCSAGWENGQRKGTEKPNSKHPTLAARASRRRGAGSSRMDGISTRGDGWARLQGKFVQNIGV